MVVNQTLRIVHVTECLASGTMNFLMQATRELATTGVRQVLLYSRRPDTPHDVRSLFDSRIEMFELPVLGGAYGAYARALRKAVSAVSNHCLLFSAAHPFAWPPGINWKTKKIILLMAEKKQNHILSMWNQNTMCCRIVLLPGDLRLIILITNLPMVQLHLR